MSLRRFIKRKFGAATLAFAGLLLLFFVKCTYTAKRESPENDALYKACKYLWTSQSPDGAWHSETHGILKSGESLTPYILHALIQVPDSIYRMDRKKKEQAIAFIRQNIQARLATDSVPLVLDYPNYSASYSLRLFHLYGSPNDSALVRLLTEHLVNEQFAEHRGIDSSHAAYGGWGFGEKGLQHGMTGHVDISHTRRVLEALHQVLPADHPVFDKARRYLDHVQNDFVEIPRHPSYLDGGFFTSIITPETNKSAKVEGVPETWYSYATATCDGLIALLAAGVKEDDRRVVQARNWLEQHKNVEYPEGIPLDNPLQWHRVMKYYHLAVRSEAYAQVGYSLDKSKIHEILADEQLADGSFMNPMGGPNKEDDPLLATTLVVIALTHLMMT